MFAPDLLGGQVAVITGGGTGLGLATAKAFLKYGASCVIAGRRAAVLKSAVEQLDPTGERALAVTCDVTDFDQVEALFDAAFARFGSVDMLVNNAAGNLISPTEALTPNAFRLITNVVLIGTAHCTLALARRWIDSERPGTILNVLTTYAQTGSPYVVPSACAKAGVEAMTRSLAAEWGRYRIRVLGIAPGAFDTEGAMGRLLPEGPWKEQVLRSIPAYRLGSPEEFANLAVYLVSPGASYINGEVVSLNGGSAAFGAGEFSFLQAMTRADWQEHRRRTRSLVKRTRFPAAVEAASTLGTEATDAE